MSCPTRNSILRIIREIESARADRQAIRERIALVWRENAGKPRDVNSVPNLDWQEGPALLVLRSNEDRITARIVSLWDRAADMALA